jgi:hypothetical protein
MYARGEGCERAGLHAEAFVIFDRLCRRFPDSAPARRAAIRLRGLKMPFDPT